MSLQISWTKATKEANEIQTLALESILGAKVTKEMFRQASLRVTCGGLGIQDAEQVSWAAYHASLIETINNCREHFTPSCLSFNLQDESWLIKANRERLQQGFRHCQHIQAYTKQTLPTSVNQLNLFTWRVQKIISIAISRQAQADFKELLRSGPNKNAELVRFQCAGLPHASAYLSAIPSTRKLFMSNLTFKAALATRLGIRLPFALPHRCVCKAKQEEPGTVHLATCGSRGGPIKVHNRLRDTLMQMMSHARMNPIREVAAWKLVGPTELGKQSFFDIVEGNTVYDVTVRHAGAKTKEKRSVANVNSNIEEGYKDKMKLLEKICAGITTLKLQPLVADKMGGLHKDLVKLVRDCQFRMGEKWVNEVNFACPTFFRYYVQVISCCIHSSVAIHSRELAMAAGFEEERPLIPDLLEPEELESSRAQLWLKLRNID